MNPKRRLKPVAIEFILATASVYLWLLFLKPFTYFSIFMERDLARATKLAVGNLIWHGPELSGAGYLPGSFYYWILSIPIRMGLGWEGAWHLMTLMHAFALGLAWLFAGRLWNISAAYLLLTSLVCSNVLIINILGFWNPSYLGLFFVLQYALLLLAFANNAHKYSWIALCFITGLALQIHMTALIPLVAGIVIQILSNKLRLSRRSKADFAIGFLALLAPLVPFFIFSITRTNFVTESAKSLPILLGGGALELGFTENWIQVFWTIGRIIVDTATPLVFICIAVFAILKLFKGDVSFLDRSPKNLHRNHYVILIVAVAIAFIPVVPVLTSFFWRFTRYSTPFTISIAFAASAIFGALDQSVLRRFIYVCSVGIGAYSLASIFNNQATLVPLINESKFYYLIALPALILARSIRFKKGGRRLIPIYSLALLLALAASAVSVKNTELRQGRSNVHINVRDMDFISKTIFSLTGWDNAEMLKRCFYVNVLDGLSFSSIYEQITNATIRSHKGRAPDGFLIVNTGRYKGDLVSRLEIMSAEKSLINLIKTKKITPKMEAERNGIEIYSYIKSHTLNGPKYFQNRGRSYTDSEFSEHIEPGAFKPTSTHQSSPDTFIFRINRCHDPAACQINIQLSLKKLDQQSIWVDVYIDGRPIFQPKAYAINSDWSESWIRPSVSIVCSKSTHREVLADQLGFYRDARKEIRHRYNNYFLAPFEYEFGAKCIGKAQAILFQWEGLMAHKHFHFHELKQADLSLQIEEKGSVFILKEASK